MNTLPVRAQGRVFRLFDRRNPTAHLPERLHKALHLRTHRVRDYPRTSGLRSRAVEFQLSTPSAVRRGLNIASLRSAESTSVRWRFLLGKTRSTYPHIQGSGALESRSTLRKRNRQLARRPNQNNDCPPTPTPMQKPGRSQD